jgi:hypothetical protein
VSLRPREIAPRHCLAVGVATARHASSDASADAQDSVSDDPAESSLQFGAGELALLT